MKVERVRRTFVVVSLLLSEGALHMTRHTSFHAFAIPTHWASVLYILHSQNHSSLSLSVQGRDEGRAGGGVLQVHCEG
jgi:hypothetical protein